MSFYNGIITARLFYVYSLSSVKTWEPTTAPFNGRSLRTSSLRPKFASIEGRHAARPFNIEYIRNTSGAAVCVEEGANVLNM